MQAQTQMNEQDFNQMEQRVLNQVMAMSKSMIESFKFRMIYGTKISNEQNQQTIKALQEFRQKNWDSSINKKEAYKKYITQFNELLPFFIYRLISFSLSASRSGSGTVFNPNSSQVFKNPLSPE